MLFSLRKVVFWLVFIAFDSLVSVDAQQDLKKIVEEAEVAARAEKQEVEAMQTNIRSVIATKVTKAEGNGSCTVGGCAGLTLESASPSKHSPFMDSKQPLIFVSASLPQASLKILAYQAVRHNARLVIRGMVKDSMVETAKLVDEIDHPLDIDPKLFERFNIMKVPVFMIYHANAWHTVSGNVDLNFAIETASKTVPSTTKKKV